MPKIIIEVEVEGPDEDAMSAIEAACDSGEVQDIFNDYCEDSLTVTSVTHYLAGSTYAGISGGEHVAKAIASRLDDFVKYDAGIAADIHKVIETRVPASFATVNSCDIPVARVAGAADSLGVLGLLNGACYAVQTGVYIMARFDDNTGKLIGFVAGKPNWKEDPK